MSMTTTKNPYIPITVIIDKIIFENDMKDLKTFRLVFKDTKDADAFKFKCGQFAMISVPGAGECPIGIASSPIDKGYVEFTVKRYQYGVVTSALHNLNPGSYIGIRGPYGNSFPLEKMKDKNIVIIGGGFAFTTLRSTINFITSEKNRSNYNNITIIYGARNPGELLYKSEISEWEKRDDIKIHITVDNAEKGWIGNKGFVPDIVKKVAPAQENTIVIICGPPLMLKFTIPVLLELGFNENRIFTSLERKMSCGIGKCGKCNIESEYVCKDGPVFNYEHIKTLSGFIT